MDVEKEALGTSNPHQFSANSTVATTPATSSRALASDPPRDQRDASPSSTTESEPQQRPQTALSEASSHYKPSKLTAILQIIAGHLIIFDTFGYIGSWGVIESYYASSLGLSFSAISWIGSVQIFLVYFIGTFSGRALDAGYLRLTLALGCLLQTGGVFATSWSTSYWQLFLSQAICQGLGNGLVFCPMISLMSTYYGDKDRAFAISFAACGAATGGMVFPAIARELLPKVGIGWTLRVMGFVFLANSLVALALVRVRVKPRPSGRLVEWESFKEVPFVLFAVGSFFAMWGVYFAYFYVSLSLFTTSRSIPKAR